MNREAHRAKALRIERSLAKCSADDVEIRIEAAMLAGTHWLNLAFHAMGVTPDTQDVMHTYMLTVNEYRRLSVADARLIGMLAEIEDLRRSLCTWRRPRRPRCRRPRTRFAGANPRFGACCGSIRLRRIAHQIAA